jgi:hypothetical protein
MAQQTLEESAEEYANDWEEIHTELDSEDMTPIELSKIDFIAGAKWQQERMYSEEEVNNLFRKYQYDLAQWVLKIEDDINGRPIPTEWFEQNKK